jgi:hypothetical protein
MDFGSIFSSLSLAVNFSIYRFEAPLESCLRAFHRLSWIWLRGVDVSPVISRAMMISVQYARIMATMSVIRAWRNADGIAICISCRNLE